jgi:hypothetical protein
MYEKIVNPKTGRKININSKIGQTIIKNYLQTLQGGNPTYSSYSCKLGDDGIDGGITVDNCEKQWDTNYPDISRCQLTKNNICKKRQNTSPERAKKNWSKAKNIKKMISVSKAFKDEKPSIEFDVPILIDEINYPLKELFVPLSAGNEYKTLKKDGGHKVVNQTDNLAIEINDLNIDGLTGIAYPLGDILTKTTDLCQSSIDVRDHFRYYIYNTNSGIKQGLLTPIQYIDTVTCQKISDGNTQEAIILRNRYNKNILISKVDEIMTAKWGNTFSSLGNVLVSPPSIHNKFGTIIYGSNIKPPNYNLNFSWVPDECPTANEYLTTCKSHDFSETYKCSNHIKKSSSNAWRISKEVNNEIFDKELVCNTDEPEATVAIKETLEMFKLQPKVEIYTGWLEVGHIDEIISFIPFPNGTGNNNFKVLIASPGKFIQIWKENLNSDKCLFTTNTGLNDGFAYNHPYHDSGPAMILRDNCGFNMSSESNPCPILIKDFYKYKALIRFQEFIQINIINNIKEKLKNVLSLDDEDFIDIPILYMDPDGLITNPLETVEMLGGQNYLPNTGIYHLSTNFINSVISTKYMISPKSFCNLPIEQYYINNIRRPGGIEDIHFVNTWDTVKYQHGGIHCYSSERRDISNIRNILPKK